MLAHLRFQSQTWATHHVVSRCLQGFAFLKPTKEIRSITKGVLGFAFDSTGSDRSQLLLEYFFPIGSFNIFFINAIRN